jgi:hypothetical protein
LHLLLAEGSGMNICESKRSPSPTPHNNPRAGGPCTDFYNLSAELPTSHGELP